MKKLMTTFLMLSSFQAFAVTKTQLKRYENEDSVLVQRVEQLNNNDKVSDVFYCLKGRQDVSEIFTKFRNAKTEESLAKSMTIKALKCELSVSSYLKFINHGGASPALAERMAIKVATGNLDPVIYIQLVNVYYAGLDRAERLATLAAEGGFDLSTFVGAIKYGSTPDTAEELATLKD